MAIDTSLRALDIDLPACPQVLVRLSLLMHDESANLHSIAALIEADMALASAMVRSVNSAMFGLLRRVESVPEAIRHLGMREVSALTFEIGLRGAFPPSGLLTALWDRAGLRGLAMGRAAPALDIDPWRAHTAGLFAESGQAALVAHDASGYAQLVQAHPQPLDRLDAETAAYGVHHAALGAALCHAWGLSGDVGGSVRLRIAALRSLRDDHEAWPAESTTVLGLLALGAAVDAALESTDPAVLQQCCERVAPRAGLNADTLRLAVQQAVAKLGG